MKDFLDNVSVSLGGITVNIFALIPNLDTIAQGIEKNTFSKTKKDMGALRDEIEKIATTTQNLTAQIATRIMEGK